MTTCRYIDPTTVEQCTAEIDTSGKHNRLLFCKRHRKARAHDYYLAHKDTWGEGTRYRAYEERWRPASPEWPAHRAAIIAAHGVKLPERMVIEPERITRHARKF